MEPHPSSPRDIKILQPLQTLIHEQAKSIIAIKELQHEVSSLLEFKNALLETFPHLQNRFASQSALQPGRGGQSTTSSYGVVRRDHRPGYLLGHPQPYAPTRHVDVVSSDETQPSWTGLETGQLTTGYQTGQNSSGVPGSTNVGTSMSTSSRGFRKGNNANTGGKKNFPDSSGQGGHLAADSGFSTETSKETASGGSAILSPTSATVRSAQPVDVRWDWPPNPDAARTQDDELMFLLDLIHRKSVRLRNEVDEAIKPDPVQQDNVLQRVLPRLAHASPLRVIDENDPPESNQSTVINQTSKKLEIEVDTLRREREVLISRISVLESENANTHGRVTHLEGEILRLTSSSSNNSPASSSSMGRKTVIEKKEDAATEAGIIHSVHIRTGGGDEGIRRTTRSVSQGDLSAMTPLQGHQQGDIRTVASGSSVNIEIKNGELIKARSQDHLAQGPPPAPTRNLPSHYQQHRYSHPSTVLAPAISVVNLRHPPGVLENLLPHQHNKSYSFNELMGSQGRFQSRNGNTFGMPQPARTQQIARGILLPGRMAVPSESASTNGDAASKSKSVENLMGTEPYGGGTVLGLKPANSEMNMHRHPSVAALAHPPAKPSRLKGTTSELNVSKLGQSEKVRFDLIEGITSLPAEMTKGLRPSQIRPNRDKIRAILSMSNVIELQRQLLTSVMENEVYRSQMERVSESWREKIGSFEKLNSELQTSLAELRQENEDLKHQVSHKTSELEATKAKLRLLGVDSSVPENDEGRQTPTKAENRVHFDLRNSRPAPTPTRLKTTLTTTSTVATGMTMGTRRLLPGPHTTQLPSDARQRLEEMVNSGIRRQPFLGNQLKAVTTSPTPMSTTTSTTISSSSATLTNPSTVTSTATPTRTPRRTNPSPSNGSRASSPVKTVHLDPIQELLSQHQNIVGNKSSSVSSTINISQTTPSQTISNQHQHIGQNGNNIYNSVQHRARRESSGTPSSTTQGRSIPQTPLSREKSLNLKNTNGNGGNNLSSDLGYPANPRQLVDPSGDLDSSEMIENNNSKKDYMDISRHGLKSVTIPLTNHLQRLAGEKEVRAELAMILENKQLEHDEPSLQECEAIALEPEDMHTDPGMKCTQPYPAKPEQLFGAKPRPDAPREAFGESAVVEHEDEFTEISLEDKPAFTYEETSTARSPLFQKMPTPSGFLSLPHSMNTRRSASVSYCGSSWEANNHLEETTHASHILRILRCSPRQSLRVEEVEEKYLSSATVSQDSLRSSKKFTDSLSHFDDKTAAFEMDSITYDFRQASPEDSLNNEKGANNFYRQTNDSYYDSLGFVPSRKDDSKRESSPTKKLIIPYNTDSFSSNTSVFTGSRESLAGSEYDDNSISSKTAEPDSLAASMSVEEKVDNMTNMHMSPIQNRKRSLLEMDPLVPPIPSRRLSANAIPMSGSSPPTRITEVWHASGYPQPYRNSEMGVSVPVSRTQSPIRVLAQQNPIVSQSLMRMATERMKRKFLGWN